MKDKHRFGSLHLALNTTSMNVTVITSTLYVSECSSQLAYTASEPKPDGVSTEHVETHWESYISTHTKEDDVHLQDVLGLNDTINIQDK